MLITNAEFRYDVVGANGGLWFYIPPMVSFFLLLSDLVGEKEQRLRLGLQLMGARGSAYWLSWFIWSVVMNMIANTVLILSGYAFQISFFTNSNIFVLFFLFGSFGVSCVCMAMGCRLLLHFKLIAIHPHPLIIACSSMVNNQRTAQTVGYAAVLIGFVFQSVLQSGYGCGSMLRIMAFSYFSQRINRFALER
jgi:hypothetical protein